MAKSKFNKEGLVKWLVLAALGVLIILGRQLAKNILYILIGAGLIIVAATGIYGWWKEKSGKKEDITALLGSIVMGIAGLWIVLNPGTFDKVINVVIGAVLIIIGAQWLIRSWKKDTFITVLSIVAIVLGLVIAVNNAATTWVVIAEGIGLIYTALIGFITEKRLG